jgi:seryl-tRNA synthetase
MQIDNDATVSSRLDSQIRQKDQEIAKLQKETGHLISNNKKLANEIKTDKKIIASLKNDLNENTKSYEEKLSALQNERDNLMRQRDSLLAKYNKIFALGSVLHASNIRLTAVHIKRSGKEKDTKRARRADELKIDFDIDENRIAENGTKQLYLVIKDPSGNLLSDAASGSGSTTSSNGTQLNYTVLKEIPIVTNEPVKDITVEWKKESDYEKGTYTITIYNGGYRIGGGQVELR